MKTIIIDGIEYNLTPKVLFKKGDWVVIDGEVLHVKEVTEDGYLTDEGWLIPFRNEKEAHIWTIQDAKAGDVLVCKGEIKYSNGIKYERICLFNNLDNAFFALTKTSNFVEEYDIDVNIDYPDNTVPATKEQKEILFTAIKNAGYEFDFEKKELKKTEQKITWSEDDERIALSIEQVMNCASLLNIVPEKADKIRTWLKSLKNRYTWKPSEGQLECLGYAIEKAEKDWSPLANNRIYLTLKALKEHLEKL